MKFINLWRSCSLSGTQFFRKKGWIYCRHSDPQSVEFNSQYNDMYWVVQKSQFKLLPSVTVRTSEYTQNQTPDTVRERLVAVTSVKALIYLAIRTPPYEMHVRGWGGTEI